MDQHGLAGGWQTYGDWFNTGARGVVNSTRTPALESAARPSTPNCADATAEPGGHR